MDSQLDFAESDTRTGFRLQRLELFNWGTFHDRIWVMTPGGENSLLTGDIGSGKSTLVDAVTTLLVPAQRITYNKAAGAEARERTLKSYVLGYYKSERSETGLSSRAVSLRDYNNYTVILGHFYNLGYDRHVTLAQVFWMKVSQGQPERFYVVAQRPLTIAGDFADFGKDLANLRKRLRQQQHVEVFDRFPAYGNAFRRYFGIENEQALELFNQTVSMKSVGNLTDFVRDHMLEAFPVENRIQALIGHFDDLNRAHEAVLKAREQIQALEPMIADIDQYAERSAKAESLRACREALRSWFAGLKEKLLNHRLEKLDAEYARINHRVDSLTKELGGLQANRDDLKQAIAEEGGDRLERIKKEIKERKEQKQTYQNNADKYRELAEFLNMPDAVDAGTFHANQQAIAGEREAAENRKAELQNRLNEAGVELQGLRREHESLDAEITSLRNRRSNIPAAVLRMRELLCEALDLTEDTLPFVGELIQVRDTERDWEGAIERVLHNFGLSLLVPDSHYATVADWVDGTDLRGRLVYFRVRERDEGTLRESDPQSLVRKLVIKPGSGMFHWLEHELIKRFDYVCCENMDEFRRRQKALTRYGQIKASGERHEKDDRHRIDDPSRYVLGWNNEAKIAALRQQAEGLERRMQKLGGEITDLQTQQKEVNTRLERLSQLEMFTDFRFQDWRPLAGEIERLEIEYRELKAASDVLKTLQEQLAELENTIKDTEHARDGARDDMSRNRQKHTDAVQHLDECRSLVQAASQEDRERYSELEAMRPEAIGEQALTLNSCDKCERDMREWLQKRIDVEDKQINILRDRIIKAMQSYKNDWPLDTREVDAGIDAADEYRGMLEQLTADDLPRFEARFKELLNENTIREVAGFQAQLNRERQEIRERIETINHSLHAIDYNPGRYIKLLAESSPDPDIREFQQNLRACTEGTLTGSGDEQYSEAKFLQVKAIIERFRGREGTTDLDRRWTRKVTDVRNWFVFSASERWREDDKEHEHYSDSGGKSGGQKEKLAYTVLAASLAYQFGLEWGETRSRSFRFVVIDEAFGRGSDESARYGLELFKRLNLQLLVVTPLQKIHIIEPYVSGVGFVHSPDGHQSLLRNLTIEEYRTEKAAVGRIAVQ
jgi:uncharacterized protein YPO0396